MGFKSLRITGGIIAVWIFAAGCTGLAGEPEIRATFPPPPTPITVPAGDIELALGQQIFSERCSTCHGDSGRGDGVLVRAGSVQNIPDMTDITRRANITLEEYFDIITYGRIDNMMPPWENALSVAERRAVARYAYSLADFASSVPPPVSTADPAPALDVETGQVRGNLIAGTAGADLPDSVEVSLFVLNTLGEDIRTVTTFSQPDGTFTFEDVPFQQNYAYVASVEYRGVAFISPMALARDLLDEETARLTVTVYEVTADPLALTLDLLLTQVVTEGDDVLEMLLVMRFLNNTDRVFRQETQLDEQRYESVRLRLPAGAVPVALDTLRYVWDASTGTLIDTLPVMPATEHIVLVNYFLPLNMATEIAYTIEYPMTRQAEVMLPPNQFDVQSAQFVGQGVMQFSSGLFEAYLADPVPVGDTLRMVLTARPEGNDSGGVPVLGWVLVGFGVGLIGVGGGLLMYQRYRANLTKKLVAQIAELDARHDAGTINTALYHVQRQALKKRLSGLMQDE